MVGIGIGLDARNFMLASEETAACNWGAGLIRGEIGYGHLSGDNVEQLSGDGAVADGIEDLYELLVFLPVDFYQLDELHGQLCIGMCREEISGFIAAFKDLPLLSLDHGRELVEVPDKNHLLASKGKLFPGAVEPEKPVYTVQEVGPDHGDFVYDHGVGRPVDIFFPALYDFFYLFQGNVGLESEERMDGLSFDIQGRYSGRSQDDHFFLGVLPEIFQKSGFSGAGLPGDKDVFRGILEEIKSPPEFFVDLDLLERGAADLFVAAQCFLLFFELTFTLYQKTLDYEEIGCLGLISIKNSSQERHGILSTKSLSFSL